MHYFSGNAFEFSILSQFPTEESVVIAQFALHYFIHNLFKIKITSKHLISS